MTWVRIFLGRKVLSIDVDQNLSMKKLGSFVKTLLDTKADYIWIPDRWKIGEEQAFFIPKAQITYIEYGVSENDD